MKPNEAGGGSTARGDKENKREGRESREHKSRDHPFGGDRMSKELREIGDRVRDWSRREGYDKGTGLRGGDSLSDRATGGRKGEGYSLIDHTKGLMNPDAALKLANDLGIDSSQIKAYRNNAGAAEFFDKPFLTYTSNGSVTKLRTYSTTGSSTRTGYSLGANYGADSNGALQKLGSIFKNFVVGQSLKIAGAGTGAIIGGGVGAIAGGTLGFAVGGLGGAKIIGSVGAEMGAVIGGAIGGVVGSVSNPTSATSTMADTVPDKPRNNPNTPDLLSPPDMRRLP